MSDSVEHGDNLKTIRRIGPARERWLKRTLGVHTFRDLAALSACEVEEQLRADGQVVSRSEVEAWITRARELATESPAPDDIRQTTVVTGATDHGIGPSAQAGEWKPFASFVVEFQRRQDSGGEQHRSVVHYMEEDEGQIWPGIERQHLCPWMLDRVDRILVPGLMDAAEARPAFASAPTLQVEITRLQTYQDPGTDEPNATGEPGRPFLGTLESGKPFALEALFFLGSPRVDLANDTKITYSARFEAYELQTNTLVSLGETEPSTLTGDCLSYAARLPKAVLQPGIYRMRVLLSLGGVRRAPAYLEVPILQVV